MKILIADDEDYTREGLMEEIAWEEFGIDEIMQAVNGEEALKIVKWFRPDIVLSDIRMPKMDGIAFAEEMVRLIPGSKLIFMSGYMETDYLKSAIRLSVIDYIEKPVDIAQVKKALRRAVDEIVREKKTREALRQKQELRRKQAMRMIRESGYMREAEISDRLATQLTATQMELRQQAQDLSAAASASLETAVQHYTAAAESVPAAPVEAGFSGQA